MLLLPLVLLLQEGLGTASGQGLEEAIVKMDQQILFLLSSIPGETSLSFQDKEHRVRCLIFVLL